MKKKVMLLFGGRSSEHDVSLMGYEYVADLLGDATFDLIPVYIDRGGIWHLGDKDGEVAYPTARDGGSLCTERGFVRVDAAFPLLHGEWGEDGRIQGALDVAGIPYVGADATASAVCIDKAYTKAVASTLGIPTVESVTFSGPTETEAAYERCLTSLGLPLFIKPRRLGSSVGAYPVCTEDDFHSCFPQAMQKGNSAVIVEKLVRNKRELECAFYEAGKERLVTAPGEILVDGFYGYSEKYGGRTATVPRADIEASIGERIRVYADALAGALGLRHLARIDFFLTEDGIFFNEVNTMPGFTRESLYPKMLESAGIRPRDALTSLVEDALGC